MGLSIEIGEKKILKSKWLDFSHFSTKDGYFDLYWCKTANILPEKSRLHVSDAKYRILLEKHE